MEQDKICGMLQTGIICFRLTTENAFHSVVVDFKEYKSICGLNLVKSSQREELNLVVCQERYQTEKKYQKLKDKLTEEQLDFLSYYAMTKKCIECLEKKEKNFCSICAENMLSGLKLLRKDCRDIYKTLFQKNEIFDVISQTDLELCRSNKPNDENMCSR